jgi:phytoene dehydrogenase-like protein
MSEKWETIVVGAGIGGLTAAAKLVQSGQKVLVLDKNPHPGGTASLYHRKGFAFPMGPLGFSNPDLVQKILKNLGIESQLRLRRVHYRLRTLDLDIPLSLPFSGMVNELGRIFPSDRKGIKSFFACMEEISSARKISAADTDQPRMPDDSAISASAYLQGLIGDPILRRILGSIGTREPYTGLPLLAAMWNLIARQGIWYPAAGIQLLAEGLVEALSRDDVSQRDGGHGEIRLNKEVAEIKVKDGRVIGVLLKDGSHLDSDAIISNADYKNTFLRLLKPNVVPREWQHAVSRARQTASLFQVCLGIDAQKLDLSAFKEAERMIYRKGSGDGGLNWEAPEIDPQELASQELEVSLWGAGQKIVVVIRLEADYRHFARFRSVTTRRIPEYQEYKTRLSRALIHEIGSLVPGLEQAICVMDIATPLTFEDQGSRSEGAVAGWSWDYEDLGNDQPGELIRTPFTGLFMAGYQAFSALFEGGVPTAMESGIRAAQAVLDGAGPIETIKIPGVK